MMRNIELKKFTVPITESATIDEEFSIAGIAINEITTSNGHKFIAEELRPAAIGMKGIPLLKDHDNMVDSIVGKVISSNFDELEKNIKFKARVSDEKMRSLIQRGDLNSVSIGAMVKELEETKEGDLIVRGIIIKELSLVAVPADSGATFSTALKEAYSQSSNDVIEHKKEGDKNMTEEEKTEEPQVEPQVEPKEEPKENVEAKLLKKELVIANKQIAEYEAEKRKVLEVEYKKLCEKKGVKALDISTVENSTLELIKCQVEEMADQDEKEPETKPEEPESKEESESEEAEEASVVEEGMGALSGGRLTLVGKY